MNTKDILQNRTFEVEILTPTYVGGAVENNWQEGMDYIARDDKIWILDLNRLSRQIPLEKLTLALSRQDPNITLQSLLRDKEPDLLSHKNFDYTGRAKDIKRHTFSGFNGKPYIPGSSVKGAVASVLLSFFSKRTEFDKKADPSKTLLGSFENSVMRFFQFTDSHFEDTYLINTKIFNLFKNNNNWEGGWKHSKNTNQTFNDNEFTTVYECLKPGTKGEMMLSFKNGALQLNEKDLQIPTHTQTWMQENPMGKLCNIINQYTESYLKKEIAFFEKYQFDEHSESIVKSLKNLLYQVKNLDSSSECILRMAGGSGFHSITGDWQYDNHINTGEYFTSGKRKYKSRKLAFKNKQFMPMGFIKLAVLTPENKLKREEIRLKKQRENEIEARKREEDRVLKEEVEEQARIEAAKPKMYEGNIKAGIIIDAEVIKVMGNKVTLKLYALNQENNPKDINYHGLTTGRVLRVFVKNVSKSGLIVAVEFKNFK